MTSPSRSMAIEELSKLKGLKTSRIPQAHEVRYAHMRGEGDEQHHLDPLGHSFQLCGNFVILRFDLKYFVQFQHFQVRYEAWVVIPPFEMNHILLDVIGRHHRRPDWRHGGDGEDNPTDRIPHNFRSQQERARQDAGTNQHDDRLPLCV